MEAYRLELAPRELAGVIESLHDGILSRMRWSVYADHEYLTWKNLPLETVQNVLDGLIAAYTKSIMLYRESNFPKSERFESAFVFYPEVWDLLADITTADSWSGVPIHNVHQIKDCVTCAVLYGGPP